MHEVPHRISNRLVERALDGEMVVFDVDSDRVTRLDSATAAVWSACDGHRDLDAIASDVGQSQSEVSAALARLDEVGLVRTPGMSRRQLIARAGAIAWTAPLISIVAPTPAMAASPSSPVVGTISHTCSGAHTGTFTIPVVGLPPGTDATLAFSISPGGTYSKTQTSTATGTATFSQSFPTTGSPVSSRTVTVTAISYGGNNYPLTASYVGTCP